MTTQDSETLRAARFYVFECGFSVIPILHDSKRPAIEWAKYQDVLPTDAELVEWFSDGRANIGLVTGQISGVSVVDDDSYKRNGSPQLPQLLALADEPRTWTARTPRGGRHHVFQDFDGRATKPDFLPSVDLKSNGGYVLVYPSMVGGRQYVWECNLRETPLSGWPEHVFDSESFQSPIVFSSLPTNALQPRAHARTSTYNGGGFKDGTRDADLFHAALCLLRGGMDKQDALQVLELVTKGYGECQDSDKTIKWLSTKIESAEKRLTSKDESLASRVREWVSDNLGTWLVTFCYSDLGLVTSSDKANCRKIIRRLHEDGVIESVGSRRGMYRKIERDAPILNWRNRATLTEWDIEYPFQIEDVFVTRPKNIIMVDGTTDGGKSLFMLHIAYRNACKFPGRIHYFSSEMGEDELAGRLTLFEHPEYFDQVLFKERAGNFADVIEPNDINVIDYIELAGDDFTDVGRMIREIWAKLDKGICFIARQKKTGAMSGRGGEFGWEKARLVVTLDAGKARIAKCKNWRDRDLRPVGKEWEWKVRRGWQFVDAGASGVSYTEY